MDKKEIKQIEKKLIEYSKKHGNSRNESLLFFIAKTLLVEIKRLRVLVVRAFKKGYNVANDGGDMLKYRSSHLENFIEENLDKEQK